MEDFESNMYNLSRELVCKTCKLYYKINQIPLLFLSARIITEP